MGRPAGASAASCGAVAGDGAGAALRGHGPHPGGDAHAAAPRPTARHGRRAGAAGGDRGRLRPRAVAARAAAAIAPSDIDAHLQGHLALRRIVADVLADREDAAQAEPLDVEPARALAVWQRKAADAGAAPLSRGAALGATLSLAHRVPQAARRPAWPMRCSCCTRCPRRCSAMRSRACSRWRARRCRPNPLRRRHGPHRAGAGQHRLRARHAGLRAPSPWLLAAGTRPARRQCLALHDAAHLSRRAPTARHRRRGRARGAGRGARRRGRGDRTARGLGPEPSIRKNSHEPRHPRSAAGWLAPAARRSGRAGLRRPERPRRRRPTPRSTGSTAATATAPERGGAQAPASGPRRSARPTGSTPSTRCFPRK